MGTLNLHSKQVGAFDDDAERIGSILAAHAAVAMVRVRRDEQKDEAIRSRDLIGQAKGMLMARKDISEEGAIDLLRRASQRLNIKLRDVADQVTEHRTGDLPGSPADS